MSKRELNPFEQWMVRSNLETIATTDVIAEEQAAQLRANGYSRIANAVLAEHQARTENGK